MKSKRDSTGKLTISESLKLLLQKYDDGDATTGEVLAYLFTGVTRCPEDLPRVVEKLETHSDESIRELVPRLLRLLEQSRPG